MVDDNEYNLIPLVGMLLAKYNITPTAVETGVEAVSLF
jgi:hypothetical protein